MLSRRLPLVLACVSVFATAGCDKLKTMGKGEDGGAPSSGGGGLLSFLGTDFEGEISATVSSKGKRQKGTPQQIVFGIKKPKYRIDSSGAAGDTAAQGSLILDVPTRKGYMLAHAQKMAMVIDLDKMKEMKGQIPGLPTAPKGMPNAAPAAPPKIDKTGKKDTVAGYTCEIWNITSEGKRAEVCVAEGITWIDVGELGLAPEVTVAALATEANRFPLRLIGYDAQGVEEMRMETTKVDKKKLDDARFAPPPDYKVVDMAALMNGLPGGAFSGGRPPARPLQNSR